MVETLEVYMFEQIQANIKGAVKNTITLAKADYGTLESVFVAATGIVENMGLPSIRYNIGFTDPTDADNANDVRKQISTISDLVLIASPDTINSLKGMVSSSKFHNQFFDTKKFGAVIPLKLDAGEMLIVDKRAFEG